MVRLPSRQVHLDFHTSEHIPGVGHRFDAANFQEALKLGHLNSITIFAKCHHSWAYYPTCAGQVHPTLPAGFDLTGAMIDAAHAIGVRAPIYITVGWSATDANQHPEWRACNADGSYTTTTFDLHATPDKAKPHFSWINMCPSGDYAELIYAQTREVCERYPVVDGLFYDICFLQPCHCARCQVGMRQTGKDPEAYNQHKWETLARTCTAILRERHPEATVFFNGGAGLDRLWPHALQTHMEMEDLPTTWGGYDKMPPRAKFMSRCGKDYLGMSGKFHTAWGEFGGYKHPDAMRFEASAMLMYGARCSIGDQMPPDGRMDLETYRLIGEAYAYVEKAEPWCFDTAETARLGVYLSGDGIADEGLHKMLLEKQLDFNLVLPGEDLAAFDAVILPDCVRLSSQEAARLQAFAKAGGGILLTGRSAVADDQFQLDVGAEFLGAATFQSDYLQAGALLNTGWVTSPFLCYSPACRSRVTGGDVLATVREPYFDRTYGHFCSHQNTAYKLEPAAHPGAVRKGNIIWLAHDFCRQYHMHGAQIFRDTVINALRLIYRQPVLQVSLPSAGRARLALQKSEHRYVLHLLYGSPITRGRTQVIEDLPSIHRIPVRMRLEKPIRRAYLAPQMIDLPFEQAAGIVSLTVPELNCHQMIVLDQA